MALSHSTTRHSGAVAVRTPRRPLPWRPPSRPRQRRRPTDPDWRHIGNLVLDEALAGAASGPCKRVWYGPGGMLFVQTGSGRVYQTADLESWQASNAQAPPAGINAAVGKSAGAGSADPRIRRRRRAGCMRSANTSIAQRMAESHWENATVYRGTSLIGGGVADLAIAPGNSDEIVTAGAAGVFRSVDGGRSWSGLNEDLAQLAGNPAAGSSSGRSRRAHRAGNDTAAAWPPGNKQAWIPASNADLIQETQLRLALSVYPRRECDGPRHRGRLHL